MSRQQGRRGSEQRQSANSNPRQGQQQITWPGRYESEIQRVLDRVEIREKLDLEYHITESEYQSGHDISGTIEAIMTPDSELKRAREYPPVGLAERLVAAMRGVDSLATETGYPGTTCYAGVVQNPPSMMDDEGYKDAVAKQKVAVEGLPTNGTIELTKDWEIPEIDRALSNDERKGVSVDYAVERFPSEHLPIIIRGNLHRDAREHIEKKIDERDREMQNRNLSGRRLEEWEREKEDLKRNARRREGEALLSIKLEYRADAPEAERAGKHEMHIEHFRADLSSTFNDLEVRDATGQPADNHTFNPDQKVIEWRSRTALPGGEPIEYNIYGPVHELLDIEHISASFRGEISGQTLTGTRIVDLYDETGRPLSELRAGRIRHMIRLTGDIEIDPEALAGEAKTHTSAQMRLDEHPEEAFEKVEAVCQREDITVLDIQSPGTPEPVRGQEGVFEITAGETGEGDDRAGRLEVKREFGDEGVVYADIQVTGKFTSMSKQSEVSVFEDTEDRVVRRDEGGLDTRGKSTIDIKARSASSDLNTELITKLQRGLRGVEERDWGPERDDEETVHLEDPDTGQLEGPGGPHSELPERSGESEGER